MPLGELWRQLYLSNRFFAVFSGLAALFVAGFWLFSLFVLAQVLFVLALALLILDGLMLFARPLRILLRRKLPKVLSLGDTTEVVIELKNRTPIPLHLQLVDEIPVQFQVRDLSFSLQLRPGEEQEVSYTLRPTQRGTHLFGVVNVFASTRIGLIERRIQSHQRTELPVYPSIIQMKQYELYAFDKISHHHGLKRMRRIGHSYEFDQIKNYVRGDDYRGINWKATGRRAELMVNHYQDERAQQVYAIIDKSRAMRMPFDGLSLMDHSVNSTLALANIVLKKHDRAGLITFSDVIGSVLKADSQPIQLQKFLQTLYREQERPGEANYDLLYYAARKLISGRSLLLLFSNFESMPALDRVLPVLRRINALHLLVVVFFENTEIRDFADQPAQNLEDIYRQTVARKYLAEKTAMVTKLRQYGIQAVLTRPENLSMNTINKYLELKARGLI